MFLNLKRVFSLVKFLRKELLTAEKIRERGNRRAVISVLKALLAAVSNLENEPKGLCFLFGIDKNEEWITRIIRPCHPITRFSYRCGGSFEIQHSLTILATDEAKTECGMAEGKATEVIRLLHKQPDWLQFGIDIRDSDCEFILAVPDANCSDFAEEKIYRLRADSPHYNAIAPFRIIGKRFFPSDKQSDDQ